VALGGPNGIVRELLNVPSIAVDVTDAHVRRGLRGLLEQDPVKRRELSAGAAPALRMDAELGAGAGELTPPTTIASVRPPSARPIDIQVAR